MWDSVLISTSRPILHQPFLRLITLLGQIGIRFFIADLYVGITPLPKTASQTTDRFLLYLGCPETHFIGLKSSHRLAMQTRFCLDFARLDGVAGVEREDHVFPCSEPMMQTMKSTTWPRSPLTTHDTLPVFLRSSRTTRSLGGSCTSSITPRAPMPGADSL